MVLGERACKN